MKTNYETPQIEVIELELEDAVLTASGSDDSGDTNEDVTTTSSLSISSFKIGSSSSAW